MTVTSIRSADDPVIAWRYWQVAAGTTVLSSVTYKRWVWEPGQPLRAVCVGTGHAAPAQRCACGIHGSMDLTSLRDHGLCLAPATPLVMGTVALWGKIVPDQRSWRGEFAYPTELSVVRESVAEGALAALLDGLADYAVAVGTTALEQAVGDISAAVLANQAMSAATRLGH
ncbi:MAG TPA: hypothetical protein VGV93_13485 [Acidimicrobiales bacterium]|nr:hypothetical protein [Acidimicrobiales bacterium]